MAKAKITKTQSHETKFTLEVTPRTIFGKKLKKVRKEGLVPANIYGPEFKSQSISVNYKEFLKTFQVVHETGVVYLKLNKEEIPALIKNIQYHPVSDIILHIDFRKINLTQKLQTDVPIKITGTSEAVAQKGGVLLKQLELLKVEALPQDIPQSIDLDISSLKEIGGEIKVSDIPQTSKYKLMDDPAKVIVSVVEHKEESVTPETTAAAPEVITAKPVEGEETTAEVKETAKPQPEAGKPAAKASETPKNPVPSKPEQKK